MDKVAHTPEPWKYVEILGACFVYAGQREVLSYRHSPDAENRANARLIAAAPELLAALQAEEEWRAREEDGALDPGWDYETMVVAKRRAAIAKATGSAA